MKYKVKQIYGISKNIMIFFIFILLVVSCFGKGSDVPEDCTDTDFLSSFEDLLRSQSDLLMSFEYLLHDTTTSTCEKVEFLESFEDLLRSQAMLISSFEDLLKIKWHTMDPEEQGKFLLSFEDLLERQVYLYSSFEDLNKESWQNFTQDDRIKLLRSFEDLLRRQANLLKSYQDLYKMSYGGISIEKSADKTAIRCGDAVTYRYCVKNWYNESIEDVLIIDDKLGTIASGVSLGPKEIKCFTKNTTLNGTTCNIAKALYRDPCGNMCEDKSNVVCVRVMQPGLNFDYIELGDQNAYAYGGDPPRAENVIEVYKDQRSPCSEFASLFNIEKIITGDQSAEAHGNALARNLGKIVANQS